MGGAVGSVNSHLTSYHWTGGERPSQLLLGFLSNLRMYAHSIHWPLIAYIAQVVCNEATEQIFVKTFNVFLLLLQAAAKFTPTIVPM